MNRRPPPLDFVPETLPWYQVEERSNMLCHYHWNAPGEHIELFSCIIDTDLVRPPAHYSWLLLTVLNVYVRHC